MREGKNLIIVESPKKASTFQKVLGDDYVVTSSFGHIRDLDDKGLSIDVDNGFAPQYVIPADKKKVVSELKHLASKAETVWLASDEDREGEAISWHLFDVLGLNEKKAKRIVFHEITQTAIVNALNNPREIDMNLVDAQQARRVLDRLVGYELSPVLWKRVQPKLSAGRVQSVALRLIVDREREILAFRNEPYYRVEAVFHPAGTSAKTSLKAVLDTKFPTIEEAQTFLEKCIGAEFTVKSVDKKEASKKPVAPFTTSTLQQEAGRKLRMSVSQTMSTAQKLYESGYITYMRTDSTHLSSLAIGTAKEFICANYGEQYSQVRQFKTTSKGAQEAHEAIRPTFIKNTSIEGTPQEKRLYELIWKRTVASQMADAKVLNTNIKIASDKSSELFIAQASEVLFDGFLKLYMESTDDMEQDSDSAILPQVNAGDVMEEKKITAECKFTLAPARYSEPTLVKELEKLGIGRPSTYASIITTLTKARGYVVKGNKDGIRHEVTNLSLENGVISSSVKVENVGVERDRLFPQDIGMIVSDYLVKNFGEIMDYNFTANVEKDFDKIGDGEKKWNDVIADFYNPFHHRIEDVLAVKEYSHVSRELGSDPATGAAVTAKFGAYGPYIQIGEGETRKYASLAPGQLIESITLEEALRLFDLPRTVGNYKGTDIICTKGRFGPYIKYGDKNVSLPRGTDPLTIEFEACCKLIDESVDKAANAVLAEYAGSDIKVINGNYGPYIKHAGKNYKIPKGTDVKNLTEDACNDIIKNSEPTNKRRGKK